jgi:hypothetical protein
MNLDSVSGAPADQAVVPGIPKTTATEVANMNFDFMQYKRLMGLNRC